MFLLNFRHYIGLIFLAVFCVACSPQTSSKNTSEAIAQETEEQPSVQSSASAKPMITERVSFEANGLTLSGMLDLPPSGEAKALVIFVHGYGATNVVEQNWYYDLRSRFASLGIASFVWDKPGCGESEGEFDANQAVQSSAKEVVAAAAFLRDNGVPGADKIGLWGISRAGWIAPLAMAEDKDIQFWISVSGVDDQESFGYLLQSNWRIEGYEDEVIERLYGQWLQGNQIVAAGGDYDTYLAATLDIRTDPFLIHMSGGDLSITQEIYEGMVRDAKILNASYDDETGLMIYVDGFEDVLNSLDVPVLAIFGEKDSVVDWRSTERLYQKTIGQNPNADLKIVRLADGNHNLHHSDTGSFKEMIEILSSPKMEPGYYEAIMTWLSDTVLE